MVLAAALGALGACRTPAEYQAEADAQVYAILEQRREALDFGRLQFSVEPPAGTLRDHILAGEIANIGPLTFVQCLEIGAENSREYQTQRETLYLAALDLTLEQYSFQVQQGLGGFASIVGVGTDETVLTGADYSLSKLFGTGAQLIADIGVGLAKDLTSGDPWEATTNLAFTFTQPFLRGAGPHIVEEPLTQAQRDVVYAVRDFERFRRTFAVDVANRFYQLLLQYALVENQRQQVRDLGVLLERNQAMADAGRLSDFEADQARQNELDAQNRLIVVEENYANQLDDFKFFLGLPIDVPLELDIGELGALRPEELAFGPEDEQRLVDYALVHRLDNQNALDSVDDAERDVYVAADALRAGLGLSVTGAQDSEINELFDAINEDSAWQARLDLDLPIDRFPERNAYRASLIALQQTRQRTEALGDQINADLRSSYREAQTAIATWRLQEFGVRLAERRVESTALYLEAGRADTRDQLDAQDSLLQARNALVTARIDYFLALLALWRELELLRVDERGLHVDYTDALELGAAAP